MIDFPEKPNKYKGFCGYHDDRTAIEIYHLEVITIQLRPYQEKLVTDIRQSLASGHCAPCAVLGCGGGKSVIEAEIARLANDRGNRVLFLVHRQELCDQIARTFTGWGVDMSRTDVMMVQTATRRLDKLAPPGLIITDEAHHATADTYTRIYSYFPDVPRVGFTATPIRLGQGGLGAVFDVLIPSVTTKWLIENHYLAPYKYYSYRLADTSGLHVRAGDYIKSEVHGLMEKAAIYGDTVDTYRRLGQNKQTIVYCASITASKATAEAFRRAGYAAVHLDGETPEAERADAVERFRRGSLRILCNVDLFGEGFDVPDCGCVILLRPTKSLSLFIQQSMRSMRYREGKEALIIDHVCNVFTHGLPDDPREWTLEAKKPRAKSTIHIRECPICFGVIPATSAACPMCGYEFRPEERRVLEVVDGELVEVTPEEIERRRLRKLPYDAYRDMKSFDELAAFAAARGYQWMWAVRKAHEMGVLPAKYRYLVRRFCS